MRIRSGRKSGRAAGVATIATGLVTMVSQHAAAQAVIGLSNMMTPTPQLVAGVAGGPVEASNVSSSCRGQIPGQPQHRILVRGNAQFVRLWAHSNSDTTLMVRAPNGQIFCADDTYGTDPGVDISGGPAGLYDVFVGTYAGGHDSYTLAMTRNPASSPSNLHAAVMAPSAPLAPSPVYAPAAPVAPSPVYAPVAPVAPAPVYAPVQQAPMPGAQQFHGIAGGPARAQSFGPACRGFLPFAPQHTFMVQAQTPFLRIWARSDGDSTLVVRAPNGQTFCADDVYGTNPAVDLQGAPAGQYQVFVGSYSRRARFAYELGLGYDPSSTPMAGTGMVANANVAAPGFGAPPPVYGQQGVVAAPYGQHGAPQPIVVPQGYGHGGMQPQPVYGQQAPQPVFATNGMGGAGGGGYGGFGTGQPAFGGANVTPGFMPDPMYLRGTSGGGIQAQSISPQCRGYISGQPDHVVNVTAPMGFLRIFATSQSDTTLVVRSPSGQLYCADDTFGRNPGVDLHGVQPGAWSVFVGSYNATERAPYALGITELQSVRP